MYKLVKTNIGAPGRAARPGLSLYRLPGDGAERLLCKAEVDALHLEQPIVLLDQGVLRLDQDALQRRLVEIFKCGKRWQAPNELWNQTVFQQVLRLDLAEDLASIAVLGSRHFGAEANRGRTPARRIDLLEAAKRAAAHEQDVGGIDL